MLLHVPQYPQLFNSQLEIACRIQISLVYFASVKWSALSYKSSDWDEVVLCIISELLVRKCYCNLAWKHCLSHCHHLGEFFLPIFSWCTKIRHGWESNFNFCTLIKTARVKSLVFDDQNTHTYLFCLGLHGCAGTRKEKKTMQILLKPETVSGSGISWDQHPTTQFFTGQMPFLPPN